MTAQERLREVIDDQQRRLRAGVPRSRSSAIVALLRLRDQLTTPDDVSARSDLIAGLQRSDLGGNKSLRLCFESPDDDRNTLAPTPAELERWASAFLRDCVRLAEAELVLGHAETGFMRLVETSAGRFDAWIATKRTPTGWRERADIDWWAASLATRFEPERRALLRNPPSQASSANERDTFSRQLADLHLSMMDYQLVYPTDAVIGGITVETYMNVLRRLIAGALAERANGEAPAPQSDRTLVTALASDLGADPELVAQVVAAFTLDRENAAYHAAVPGVAAAPLVRTDPERLVWSVYGLTSEPLLFLTRELRRRDAQEYHNSAHLREGVFRRDLYALFQDKRFVTSSGRIQLQRGDGGVRTDIDAVVFDRKSGTLALFELKSQDPFARSIAELARQRDNVLYANRQVSGVLDWIKRHGADEILHRVDARTAKTFRAQKVYPFVLGRYLAHFSDGQEPDRRAAWGTWPQLLRLLDGQPVRAGDANPIASLFTRLKKDDPLILPPGDGPPREIALGETRLVVHPSYAAFQAGS